MVEIMDMEEVRLKARELFTAENGNGNSLPKGLRTIINQSHEDCERLKIALDAYSRCEGKVDIPYDHVQEIFLCIMNNAIIGHIQYTQNIKLERISQRVLAMYRATITIALDRFDKEPMSSYMTIHFFYECIHDILHMLKLHISDQAWDEKINPDLFLDLIIYAMCGAYLIA